ncbi:gamma-glutamyl-gamma-aminobutyrate hydrolase family protein [Microbacterium sp. M28]|uniref:gamma-glutamyl-gamma-aminobutyrate hydrolase family protein n=1 Tax=Microbacterium sp. M28 TaxID=2962064 RepID=UPI0021F48CB5|nr:gamma-glutamyl-gamma-aminobutyrate hydrolase family protein [Microbacterium sp. M28]UYO97956.1 gamma-glutamyl-gamma-aminobutyrate hydrolase family protein [Microbacterium sp. M28]
MPHPTRRVALLHLRTRRPYAARYQAELDALNTAAAETVAGLGWEPLLVPTAELPTARTHAAARWADLIVLMGGEDVDPRLYGTRVDYPGSGHHEPRTDSTHIAVVLEAMQRHKPVLGICRGMQVINVALGGTLIQHLPTSDRHRGSVATDPFVRSRVRLVADTDLEADVDASRSVLCTHHQAIDVLGAGLRIAARAADGVAEAVVHDSAPITGVQWHPEHPSAAALQLTPLLRRLERQAQRAPARAGR